MNVIIRNIMNNKCTQKRTYIDPMPLFDKIVIQPAIKICVAYTAFSLAYWTCNSISKFAMYSYNNINMIDAIDAITKVDLRME